MKLLKYHLLQNLYKISLVPLSCLFIVACRDEKPKSPSPVVQAVAEEETSKIIKLVSGENFSCILTKGSTVKCWGQIWIDNVGEAITISSNTPRTVTGIDGPIADLVSGARHFCALLKSGSVQCWGANDRGQLGDGTIKARAIPAFVKELNSGAVKISAGSNHTCILAGDGRVLCWGANDYWQSGYVHEPLAKKQKDDDSRESMPSDINAIPNQINLAEIEVSQIAAGSDHTCLLSKKGAVYCWGKNIESQCGRPDVDSNGKTTRNRVSGAGLADNVVNLSEGAKSISVGDNHSCALLINGKVLCWGDNEKGQLGNGYVGFRDTKFIKLENGRIDSLHAQKNATCSLQQGSVFCSGELRGLSYNDRGIIHDIIPYMYNNNTAISIGRAFFCSLKSNNKVSCVGTNDLGQLGDGTFENNPTATVEVIGL